LIGESTSPVLAIYAMRVGVSGPRLAHSALLVTGGENQVVGFLAKWVLRCVWLVG